MLRWAPVEPGAPLHQTRRVMAASVLALGLAGCSSVRKVAVNSLGNALAAGGSTYASDEDPELVRSAVPFGLKTVETMLAEAPRHKGLLYAAASGFAQYAFAFVQQDADFIEAQDLSRATALRTRARKLYLRGRDYGLRGLEVDLPGFGDRMRRSREEVLARTQKRHVRLLYWTGLSWFGAISLAKNDSELSADQGLAESMMKRALELDEGFEHGALHDFYIAWEGRGESVGGSFQRAREHLDRALALAGGHRASPLVAYAESISVARQDRKEFEELLRRALAVDPDAEPSFRLANLVYQQRARWLLGRIDDLFVE
jgi:predicted anti-sigma-YlaC factor YlaD